MTLSKKEKIFRELLGQAVSDWWLDYDTMSENDYNNLVINANEKADKILSGEEK